MGRIHLVLKEVEPGRYRAEVYGAAQGVWQLTSRWLPERYQAEMVQREGRLVPLIYREAFISKGKRVFKEYHFDYERGRLSLWRQTEGGERVKKWEIPLKTPVYDPLSLFYNIRLGVLGPLHRRHHPAGHGPADPGAPGDGLCHRLGQRSWAAR